MTKPLGAGRARPDGAVRTVHLSLSALPVLAAVLVGVATVICAENLDWAEARIVFAVAAAAGVLIVSGAFIAAGAATRWVRAIVSAAGRGTAQAAQAALTAPAGTVTSSGAAAAGMSADLDALRSMIQRGEKELSRLVDQVKSGERPSPPAEDYALPEAGELFRYCAHDLYRAQRGSYSAVLEVANLVLGGDQQRVEVFVNLARRMQSLVQRQIQMLDSLEAQVEDPELLKGLFTVDHLATRMRRLTESLAVLGGSGSRRQWSRPVSMYDLLRSAIAEVEHYSRVKVVPPIDGTADGGAVADVIHLIAELIENATKFSSPDTQVLLRASIVTAGLAIEVEDRGLGMDGNDQRRTNDVLADPRRVNIGELLSDGRIGLFVVSALASRYGIKVELKSNIYGGTQAVVVLPKGLVSQVAKEPPATGAHARPEPVEAPHAASTMPAPPAPLSAAPGRALAAQSAGVPPASVPPASVPPASVPLASVPPLDRLAPVAPPPQPAAPPAPAMPSAAPAMAATSSRTRASASPPSSYPGPADNGRPDPWAFNVFADNPEPGRGSGGGDRPPLPQRRVQENLVPQLRDAPRTPATEPEPEIDQTPNLMAVFRDGVNRAEEEDPPSGGLGIP